MWASQLIGLLARPWARRVAGAALVALTITLFIVNLRRSGERAGRAAERLEQLERSDDRQRQMLDAAAQPVDHLLGHSLELWAHVFAHLMDFSHTGVTTICDSGREEGVRGLAYVGSESTHVGIRPTGTLA